MPPELRLERARFMLSEEDEEELMDLLDQFPALTCEAKFQSPPDNLPVEPVDHNKQINQQ